jgi:uncharacterized protein (DUF362 family)
MDLILTSNDALALDVTALKIMGLSLKEVNYLNFTARKTGLHEDQVAKEGLRVFDVARKFERPRIDLPVKAQMEIYKHEYLTKVLFCSLDVVKIFQRMTKAYRQESRELSLA